MKLFNHKIAGYCTDVFNKCSSSEQRKINSIDWVVIITAIFSAGFMILALDILFSNPVITIFTGLIWFFFIIGFDRTIILGNSTLKLNIGVRIFAALVFALLHSLIVDTVIFNSEIENLAKHKVFDSISSIKQSYKEQLAKKETLIKYYADSRTHKENAIKQVQDRYIEEADGTSGSLDPGIGGLTTMKREAYEDYKGRMLPTIAQDSLAAARLHSEIANLKTEEQKAIAKLENTPIHLGLLVRNELLHEVLSKSSFTTKLFAFVWFLVVVLIECLPLIAKHSISLDEYDFIDHNIKQQNLDQVNAVLQLETTQRLNKLQSNLTIEQLQTVSDEKIKASEIAINEIKKTIDLHEDACNYWFNKKVEVEKALKEEFDEIGQPLFESTKKKLVKLS
jgi:hypothetical protein